MSKVIDAYNEMCYLIVKGNLNNLKIYGENNGERTSLEF